MFAAKLTLRCLSAHALVLVIVLANSEAKAQGDFLNLVAVRDVQQLVQVSPPSVTRTASPSKSVGNSNAGANVQFPIQITSGNGCALVKVTAKSGARLLGKSATAIEVEAFVKSCSDGNRTSGVKAKVAGFTVSLDNKSFSFTWEKNVTRTLLSAGTTVWVGPVPVTVKGSVAGSLSAKLALTVTTSDAAINGPLSLSVKGTASGSVGVPGYSVGVEAVLELLKSSLVSALRATFSQFSGSVQLCFEPFSIKLNLKVKLWPFSWSHNLANYSYSKSCAVVLSL
jgi:hypothetical protein